ncbi:MAG: hypothetical protein JNM52_03955, partial [Betaproteobacteria bacterium]|nr:hypothetical protein [Betaproteobacteria bacterium]
MKTLLTCLILFWAELSVAGITLSLENNQVTVSYGQYQPGTGIRFADANTRTHQLVRAKFWESLAGCIATSTPQEIIVNDCS